MNTIFYRILSTFRATIFSQLPRKLRTHDLMSLPGERRYQPYEGDYTVIEHYG